MFREERSAKSEADVLFLVALRNSLFADKEIP